MDPPRWKLRLNDRQDAYRYVHSPLFTNRLSRFTLDGQ